MGIFYKSIIRPIFFRFDPEKVHDFTIRCLGIVAQNQLVCSVLKKIFAPDEMPVNLFGLHFPNPVGLAAGMDKNCDAIPIWEALGFGFAEMGAVTALAQPGNPKPRIFRIIPEQAIINRMGFNNKGADEIAAKLSQFNRSGFKTKIPLGINLGKSRIVPLQGAPKDYETTFCKLWEFFDFFVVNVSSPNTPNLRLLQNKENLREILHTLTSANKSLAEKHSSTGNSGTTARPKPILVKIAPDLSYEAIEEALAICFECDIAGIVATNTTITRPSSSNPYVSKIYKEEGGLSGRPLKDRSTEIIRFIYKKTGGKLPIIGVGGIFTPQDAWEKIAAGASLIQVYTGMIYEGPSIAKSIVTGLRKILDNQGIKDIKDAVGVLNR